MINIFRFSFMRIVKKREFYIVLLLTLLISIAIPLYLYGSYTHSESGSFVDTFYLNNINEMPLIIILYASPIISGVLTSEIVHDEVGVNAIIYSRYSRFGIYFATIAVCFFIGFILMFIMNILIGLYTYIMIGLQNHNEYFFNNCLVELYDFDNIKSKFMFSDLLIRNPVIRILLYVFLLSVFNGLLYIFSYSINFLFKSKYLGYIVPFLCTSISMMLCSFFGSSYYLQKVVDPQLKLPSVSVIYITFFCICIISIAIGVMYHKMQER